MKSSLNIWIAVLSILALVLFALNISLNREVAQSPVQEDSASPVSVAQTKTIMVSPIPVTSQPAIPESIVPKPVIAPASVGKNIFTIQVASFSSDVNANAMLTQVMAAGFAAYLVKTDLNKSHSGYRILIGKFATRAEADHRLGKIRVKFPGSFVNIVQDNF